MTLTSGTKLGPYQVESPLGAGGMGEVYRARDTRLDRTVAVKILPAHLSENADARARFEREARSISGLNHPNICTLFDVGCENGVDYLVMEFLEGETLADRLRRGPLPIDQLAKIAIEVAEGLDRAHRSGIIHRDLKPGNIMLTKGGAKLMDFGLAKAAAAGAAASSGLSATLEQAHKKTHPLTAEGTLVGTFQYMSPEQVEGKEADARSDLFAFGAVLYEMATGRRAFEGKSMASVIAAVLAAEPKPVSQLMPMSPPALDQVIKTCLAKDPDERFQSAHDIKLQMRWVAEGGSKAGVPAPVAVRRKHRETIAWTLAAVAVVAALVLGVVNERRSELGTRVIRSTLLPPEGGTFVLLGPNGTPVLSPDGHSLAFVGRFKGVTQIWVRPLDSLQARPLAGTDDAYAIFWSPDSKNLGFFADSHLKRIPAAGGAALALASVDQGRGGAWSKDDVILFARYPGELFRISASGGTPQQASHLDPTRHDTTHRWPHFLPDGNHFLYMGSTIGSANPENAMFVGSLDGKTEKMLFHGSSQIVYYKGYLLYVVEKTLTARPFDLGKLEFTGDPVSIADGIQFDPIYSNAVFSVSDNGLMLYQTGAAGSQRKLDVLSMDGKLKANMAATNSTFSARLSPDSKKIAFTLIDQNNGKADIWVEDIATTNRTRLTIDPVRSQYPVWSRDGQTIAFASMRSGKFAIYTKPANGMGLEQKLYEGQLNVQCDDWVPDGKSVLVQERVLATGKFRIIRIPTTGGAPTVVLEDANASLTNARLSPNGKWIAYQSDESGKNEVYVAQFPNPSGKLQISVAGGRMPAWRHDGRTIYYVQPDGMLMGVEISETGGTVQAGALKPLFAIKSQTANDSYDVFSDGRGFLANTITTEEVPSPLNLVVNWDKDLKK